MSTRHDYDALRGGNGFVCDDGTRLDDKASHASEGASPVKLDGASHESRVAILSQWNPGSDFSEKSETYVQVRYDGEREWRMPTGDARRSDGGPAGDLGGVKIDDTSTAPAEAASGFKFDDASTPPPAPATRPVAQHERPHGVTLESLRRDGAGHAGAGHAGGGPPVPQWMRPHGITK